MASNKKLIDMPKLNAALKNKNENQSSHLDGQLLLAMPSLKDQRFERAVIFLCAHSPEGSMGIVINHIMPDVSFSELMTQLNLGADHDIRLPSHLQQIQVLRGGPVESGRGFVLHSTDYYTEQSTLNVGQGVCLTATLDILEAIAAGKGPRHALLALGYAGWAPGQLEAELQANSWLHCAPDESLLFDTDMNSKYDRAMKKLGIDPRLLSRESGHA